jgi:hypothetical protein
VGAAHWTMHLAGGNGGCTLAVCTNGLASKDPAIKMLDMVSTPDVQNLGRNTARRAVCRYGLTATWPSDAGRGGKPQSALSPKVGVMASLGEFGTWL